MTRIHIITVTLTVSLATILCVGARALSQQRDRLDRLRDQIRGSEQSLVTQRRDLGAAEQDLSSAESQLSALAPADAPTAARDARKAVAAAWIGRVKHVRRLFEENPQHRVPYLRLLTDEDWLRATLPLKFDDAMSDRYALSVLRMAAARRYGTPLQQALDRYVLATGDIMPSTVSVIAPYFDDPAESEGLSQFEAVAGNNGSGWALRSTPGPDPQNYGQVVITPTRRLQ